VAGTYNIEGPFDATSSGSSGHADGMRRGASGDL
jgi:hypothetical protein